jgi:hypothetical protein
MPWFKICEKSAFHAKIVTVGNRAWGALCRAGAWSSDQLTDGLIPPAIMESIDGDPAIWERLVLIGLMDRDEAGGMRIHDFLDYNPSAAEVRETNALRAAAGRKGGKRKAEALALARHGLQQTPSNGSSQSPSPDVAKSYPVTVPVTVPEREETESGVGGPAHGPNDPTSAILAALRRHRVLASVAHERFACTIAERYCREHQRNMMAGKSSSTIHPLADVVQCIAEAAEAIELDEAANNRVDPDPQRRVVGFIKAGPRRKTAAAEPPKPPKLPPGTGELPPVLTAPPRPTAPREPPDNPVLRALGASPRPQSGAAPTSIGDLLANLAPPQSFEGSK